jgi:hypothetical protein
MWLGKSPQLKHKFWKSAHMIMLYYVIIYDVQKFLGFDRYFLPDADLV